MPVLTGTRHDRFRLVNAAHEFLLEVLPFRHPQSRRALAGFVAITAESRLSRAEIGAILVNVLAVLTPQAGGRLPSLMDRYLVGQQYPADAVDKFRDCVEDVIRYRGIGSPDVQHAIAIIEECYAESTLTQREVADRCAVSSHELSVLFGPQTGVSFSQYLRNTRLDRAAALLTGTNGTIKQIWAAVGYNHPSNFDHDFKQRFGVPPREYRSRAITRWNTSTEWPASESGAPPVRPELTTAERLVMVMDDNPTTRETIARHLSTEGFTVAAAATGKEGLRELVGRAVRAILVDYHLPDMDGVEWLRALRRQQPTISTHALIFTADWELADRTDEIRELGAVYVSKLCDLDELTRLVTSLCEMHRLQRVP
jgi:AraC-like DNA-binding protein/CheY-like chemotaxis protein